MQNLNSYENMRCGSQRHSLLSLFFRFNAKLRQQRANERFLEGGVDPREAQTGGISLNES